MVTAPFLTISPTNTRIIQNKHTSLFLRQAEKTETEQIYKMLELLPKRGPHAFERFVGVLERDYPWLATLLVSGTKSTPIRETTTRESTRHDLASGENSRGKLLYLSYLKARPDICDSSWGKPFYLSYIGAWLGLCENSRNKPFYMSVMKERPELCEDSRGKPFYMSVMKERPELCENSLGKPLYMSVMKARLELCENSRGESFNLSQMKA